MRATAGVCRGPGGRFVGWKAGAEFDAAGAVREGFGVVAEAEAGEFPIEGNGFERDE
jgi:hypothetical protein